MRFWDSSAIVPLLVEQPSSESMRRIAKADPVMHVWWGTSVECVSAVSRLERMEKKLRVEESTIALDILEAIAGNWIEIEATEIVRERARRLLRVHDLRTGDAFQLAAALVACEGYPRSAEFVCLDDRLNKAALREGFRVVNRALETKPWIKP